MEAVKIIRFKESHHVSHIFIFLSWKPRYLFTIDTRQTKASFARPRRGVPTFQFIRKHSWTHSCFCL